MSRAVFISRVPIAATFAQRTLILKSYYDILCECAACVCDRAAPEGQLVRRQNLLNDIHRRSREDAADNPTQAGRHAALCGQLEALAGTFDAAHDPGSRFEMITPLCDTLVRSRPPLLLSPPGPRTLIPPPYSQTAMLHDEEAALRKLAAGTLTALARQAV